MAKKPTTAKGFTLGDHTFISPDQNGSLSRLDDPKKQIKGAQTPTYLAGLAVESTSKSPAAKALFKGEFCGHSEPTMTIFDIVIDGAEELEIGVAGDKRTIEDGEMPLAFVARKPGSKTWTTLFHRDWADAAETLEGVKARTLTAKEVACIHPDLQISRVSIGFEYPCDATSADCVTWMAIDILLKGEKKPICIINAELA
jgi:hypothetical protein